MNKGYKSNRALKDFVEIHELMNSHSIVHFNALVSIETAEESITNQEMQVLITFDDYQSIGKVSLLESDLNPYSFPTVFEAKWQKMEHQNNQNLHISDTHTRNPKIGAYEVYIVPTGKVKN